jgi:hypothetical protein
MRATKGNPDRVNSLVGCAIGANKVAALRYKQSNIEVEGRLSNSPYADRKSRDLI